MMATVQDLIISSLRRLNVLTKSELPSNSESQEALEALNDLIDSWSNSSYLNAYRTQETYPLTSGVATYTIGSGGDFNTQKPNVITSAIVSSGDTDYTLKMITDSNYLALSNKDTVSIPSLLSFNNAYPLGVISLYPSPSAGYTITIETENPFAAYTSTNDVVNLPNGWRRALIYNLAVDLAPEYGQTPSPTLEAKAKEAKAYISLNSLRNNLPLYEVDRGYRSDILSRWGGV